MSADPISAGRTNWITAAAMAVRRLLVSDRRLWIMAAYGFVAGLPLPLTTFTFRLWLSDGGVSLAMIGLTANIGLAYSLKFVWAPVIDRVDVPVLARLLGRRRGWMLLAQAVVAIGLLGIAASDPQTGLGFAVACALLVAFASATQDIVIDGWRIDAAPTERQGLMSAAYQLGYRLALICSGAGAFYIAEFVSWSRAYETMAALMLVGVIGTLLAPRIDIITERERFTVASAVIEPFSDLIRRKGAMLVAILALIALFRLPDFVAGVMANPLYIDIGFSKTDIANVSKLYGVWIGIAGAFAGGLALGTLGLWPTLVTGAAIAAGSNIMFAVLARAGADLTLLVFTISIDNFASGFAGSALIAYMSALTAPGLAATQYALLSSLYALPGKLIGGVSGVVVDTYGYPVLFLGTAAIGLPLVALCFVIRGDVVQPAEAEEDIQPLASTAGR